MYIDIRQEGIDGYIFILYQFYVQQNYGTNLRLTFAHFRFSI